MKKVVLTGCNGGVGKSTLSLLLANGYKVYGLDIGEEPIIKDDNLTYIKCDISNEESRNNAIKIVSNDTDELYAIINLAGIFKMESIIEGSSKDLEEIIRINFFGMYYLNKGLFHLLKPNSRIINMSSEVARYSPQPFMNYYSMSKKMVDTYSDVLRRECNYLDIKVIKIQSGSLNTRMLNKANDEYDVLINNTKYFKSPLTTLKGMMTKELKKTNNPDIIGKLIIKILGKKKPKICYRVKNSFALRFVNSLPERLQDYIYKKVIK